MHFIYPRGNVRRLKSRAVRNIESQQIELLIDVHDFLKLVKAPKLKIEKVTRKELAGSLLEAAMTRVKLN